MIEFREDSRWYFNGKVIDDCNPEELKAGYREFYKGKTKEELQTSLGMALEVENYIKCAVIKEIYGDEYLEPIPSEVTLRNIMKKVMDEKSNS